MKKWMAVLFSVVMLVILSACSKGPQPEERFQKYVSLWNDQDFSGMYDYLSSDAKKSITKQEFTERYQQIYKSIETENLSISYEKPEEPEERKDEEEASLPFSLKMDTLAGPVAFDHQASLVKEETDDGDNWFISWNPSMIFPQLKEGDAVRISEDKPERGSILDKNGKGLAINAVVPEIQAVPEKLGSDPEAAKEAAAKLLNLTVEDIDKKLSAIWVKPDMSVPVAKVDPSETELLKKVTSLPGFQKADVSSRYYPLGENAAHLTGYIGNISGEELQELKGKGYTSTSQLGKAGLEEVYEDDLRGQTGFRIYTDPSNETIAERPAEDGKDITVTIDSALQTVLYNQLKGDSGTAAAVHPLTGETLALVSSPAYNPNSFVFGMSGAAYQALTEQPGNPLSAKFNKTFSPGSVFKPLTAAAGLKAGTLNPAEVKTITGLTWKKGPEWGNYSVTRVTDAYSAVDLKRALVSSDNIYFAQAALEMGADAFKDGAAAFGLGERFEFDFPTADSSVAESDLAAKDVLLADSGYGQGEVLMSPVHIAASYTAFVNNGSMIMPYLEKKDDAAPEIWKEGILTPEQSSLILNHLISVVDDSSGTGHEPVVPGLKLAGKTGTAELKMAKGEIGQENGWFVAVNTDQPKLLIAMMIEDVKDRGGSHYVVPKVKQAFSAYLKQ